MFSGILRGVNHLQERRAKARALALLGAMALVSLALWQWPAPPGERPPLTRPDVILPAPVAQIAPVALPQTMDADRPGDAPRPAPAARSAMTKPMRDEAPARELAAHEIAVDAVPVHGLPAEPLPPDVLPAEVRSGETARLDSPAPLRARPHVLTPLVPALPSRDADSEDSLDRGFVRAGVALGKAFKRAGTSTAGAFSRIF